jgi:hypothetical protein
MVARLVPLLLLSTTVLAQPVRVVVTELDVSGLAPSLGPFLSDHLAQQLALQPGLKVTTRDQIAAVLGLERQRQLTGCVEGTSCTAELLGALGGEALVVGRVARVGQKFAVNLKLLSARSADALSFATGTFSSEDELLPFLAQSAEKFAAAIGVALAPRPAPVSLRGRAWIPLLVGGAVGLAGAALSVVSFLQAQRLTGNDPTLQARQDYQATLALGRSTQVAGVVLLGCSAAALLVSAGMALFGAEAPVAVTLSPAPGGVALLLGGAF